MSKVDLAIFSGNVVFFQFEVSTLFGSSKIDLGSKIDLAIISGNLVIISGNLVFSSLKSVHFLGLARSILVAISILLTWQKISICMF